MDSRQSAAEREASNLYADEGGRAGYGQQRLMTYWCYQCNKQVMAEVEEGGRGVAGEDTVCPDCGTGFIEMIATTRAFPGARRAGDQARNRRRSSVSSGDAIGRQRELNEENDDLYQHVSRLLQALAGVRRDVARRSAEQRRNSRAQRDTREPQERTVVHAVSCYPSHARDEAPEEQDVLEGEASNHPQVLDHGLTEVDASVRNLSLSEGETHNSGLVEEQSPDVTEDAIVRDGSLSQEEEADLQEERNISDAEERLDFVDWGFTDVEEEEEWEEVEEDVAGELDGEPRENNYQLGGREWREHVVEGDDQQSTTDNTSRNGARSRNSRNTIIRRFLEYVRDLHGFELLLEIPQSDTYVGNPGDYLDARGYEQFLQQLLESDNSCKGAPPAAKLAVEGLLSITIQQKHLNDGSAVCAICKDTIAFEEHAKQMPCLHLYHSDCILQWLSSRNSCPVCRYELPTDDTDYEEQKRNHGLQQILQESTSYQDAGVNSGLSNHQEEDNELSDNEENSNRQSDYTEERDILDSLHRDGSKSASD